MPTLINQAKETVAIRYMDKGSPLVYFKFDSIQALEVRPTSNQNAAGKFMYLGVVVLKDGKGEVQLFVDPVETVLEKAKEFATQTGCQIVEK